MDLRYRNLYTDFFLYKNYVDHEDSISEFDHTREYLPASYHASVKTFLRKVSLYKKNGKIKNDLFEEIVGFFDPKNFKKVKRTFFDFDDIDGMPAEFSRVKRGYNQSAFKKLIDKIGREVNDTSVRYFLYEDIHDLYQILGDHYYEINEVLDYEVLDSSRGKETKPIERWREYISKYGDII